MKGQEEVNVVVENPEPLLEASSNPKIAKKAAIIILMGAMGACEIFFKFSNCDF